jgi:hypothetical protein
MYRKVIRVEQVSYIVARNRFLNTGENREKMLDMAQRVGYNVTRRSLRMNWCASTIGAVTKAVKWD